MPCFKVLFYFILVFYIFGGIFKKTVIPLALVGYIEDITRWREDMNFMYALQEQYLTSKRSELVSYCSCHGYIKFICSS